MRHAYEILRDPTDRYLLWDLDDDAPVVSANRILTFPALADSRRFLDTLQLRDAHAVPSHWRVAQSDDDKGR